MEMLVAYAVFLGHNPSSNRDYAPDWAYTKTPLGLPAQWLAGGSAELPRLWFTRAEAQAEAKRRATEFVAGLPGGASARYIGASPDPFAHRSRCTKHSVSWVVAFKFHPPEMIMDGGDLLVTVDLETGAVAARE
jgi:hypothetical protein